MAEPGRYCLKWNQYQDNFSGTIQDFRKGFEFSDVTLACDDEQIQAHKLILSASSPLLRTLFHRYNHPNPLVLLRGIRTKDMEAVVDFIYQGEVDVSQENLQGFLSLARDLQIKGLTGGSVKDKMEHSEKNVTNLSINDSSKEFSDGKLKSNIEMVKEKRVFPNESEEAVAVSNTGVCNDLTPSENVETGDEISNRNGMVNNENISKNFHVSEANNYQNISSKNNGSECDSSFLLENSIYDPNFPNVDVNEKHVAAGENSEENVEMKEEQSDDCDRDILPEGWKRIINRRISDDWDGKDKFDYYIKTDQGLKFRSQVQVDNYLRLKGIQMQVKLKPSITTVETKVSETNKNEELEYEKVISEKILKGNITSNGKEENEAYFYTMKPGDDIDTVIGLMMEKKDGVWKCKVCDTTRSAAPFMERHIENHIGGTSYSCGECNKTLRTRFRLEDHMKKKHKDKSKSIKSK